MTTELQPILDFRGDVMFPCIDCGAPLTHHDFFTLGLRVPDQGESADDYRDAELIDGLRHADCSLVRQAS